MTDLRNQRRIAAEVLRVGSTRVWIDPLHAEDVAGAVTRQDVRRLVAKGYIAELQARGVSRGRARFLARQKSKGKRKGPGSRKGAEGSRARDPPKQRWMRTVRAVRGTLQLLREEGLLGASQYRLYYRRAKGGSYRSRAHLLGHLVTDGVLTEDQARDARLRAEAARAARYGRKQGRAEARAAAPAREGGEA